MRFVVTLALMLGSAHAQAEVIQLLDNTQVAGKILHYYEGAFDIELTNGQKTTIPTNKIKTITFKLPPPRPEFSTPEKTFARYKDSVAKSDLNKMIDCYALMYQSMLSQQMGSAPDEFQKMKKEIDGVKFEVKGSKITGSTATLKVQRTKGDDVETAEIHMVLENGEWKMTP